MLRLQRASCNSSLSRQNSTLSLRGKMLAMTLSFGAVVGQGSISFVVAVLDSAEFVGRVFGG